MLDAFRVRSQDWSDLAFSKPHRVTRRGVVFDEPGPGRTKLGAFGRGVFFWEGRMDALLSDTTASWALRPVSDLVVAEAAARQAFDELTGQPMDYDSPLEGEVRRFDLAHEFRFEQGRDGLAFLRTLSGMCPPRRKLQTVTGQDGQPQTVYVRH